MSRRIEYLDAAKFIGLVLVCYCHIPYPEGQFHIWVYSFHMPLFFLISGIFFNVDRFAVSKSVKQLLIPFIFYNLLACIISTGIGLIASGELKLPSLSSDFILKSAYIIGPSWFLVSLFLIRIYCGLVLRYLGNIFLVVSTVGILAVFFCTRDSAVWDVASIGSTVLGLPFYIIGFYSRRFFIEEGRMRGWWIPFTALIFSVPAIYNGQVGIHAHGFGDNMLLFILFGISGTVLIISLSKYIKLPHSILNVFMDGALFFICMHTLIFEYSILIWNKLTNDFSGNTIAEKIVFTALTFVISYPIIVLMLKRAPVLLGKSKHKKNTDNVAHKKNS